MGLLGGCLYFATFWPHLLTTWAYSGILLVEVMTSSLKMVLRVLIALSEGCGLAPNMKEITCPTVTPCSCCPINKYTRRYNQNCLEWLTFDCYSTQLALEYILKTFPLFETKHPQKAAKKILTEHSSLFHFEEEL